MQGQVDFDDKSSWEYLFKDYWIDLKERLSLTLDKVNQAKSPWNEGSDVPIGKHESPDELYDAYNDERSAVVVMGYSSVIMSICCRWQLEA